MIQTTKFNNMNKNIIPVIHIVDYEQVKVNIETCLRNNINKVFLIDMNSGPFVVDKLFTICKQAKEEFPELWM